MALVPLDVDFMVQRTSEQGLDLVESAVKHSPDLLFSLLEAGWGKKVRENHAPTSRKFLTGLFDSQTPETGQKALGLYFSGASNELINERLMKTSANEPYSPVLGWIMRHSYSVKDGDTKTKTLSALVKEAKSIGADLESTFTFSIVESGTSKSSNHTILSALVGKDSFRQDADYSIGDNKSKVLCLIEAGKLFDKNTAAVLVRMPSENAKIWTEFFLSSNITTASEILQMTSRLKSDPQTKAVLASLSAMEMINSVLQSQEIEPRKSIKRNSP